MDKILASITIFIGTLSTTSLIVQAIIIFILFIVFIKTLGKYGILEIIASKFKKKKPEDITEKVKCKITEIEKKLKETGDDIVKLLESFYIDMNDKNLEIISEISKLDISINRMEKTISELKADIKDRDTLKEMNFKLDNMRDSAGKNW